MWSKTLRHWFQGAFTAATGVSFGLSMAMHSGGLLLRKRCAISTLLFKMFRQARLRLNESLLSTSVCTWERKAGFSFSALGFKAPALKHFCFKADFALAIALKPSSHFPILSIP
jgi:hypothetical protein